MLTGRYNQWLKPRHKFQWFVMDWKAVSRYGLLGASEKEFGGILSEAIENWLKVGGPLSFRTRPIPKYSWPGGAFKFLDW